MHSEINENAEANQLCRQYAAQPDNLPKAVLPIPITQLVPFGGSREVFLAANANISRRPEWAPNVSVTAMQVAGKVSPAIVAQICVSGFWELARRKLYRV